MSPQLWAAVLAAARHRRAPWLWPPAAPPACAAYMDPGGLVRTYVLRPEERQHSRPPRKFSVARR
ncbi:MAG: hypothetical protein JF621_02230 [Streptomyces turgidiscabies]|nr:hypothetical protein [Streptomyces turgidiscabies]